MAPSDGEVGRTGRSRPGSGIPVWGSLRFRLTVLVVLALVPAFGLVIHAGLQRREDALLAAGEAAQRLSRVAARSQEEAFDEARQVLNAISLLPPVRGVDAAESERILAGLLRESSGYLNFGLAGPDGKVLASALPFEEEVDLSDRTYFRRALQTRRFSVGRYQIGRITHRASINVGHPILDASGSVRAVLFAALDLGWLRDLSRRVTLPEDSTLLVVDETGTLVVRYPEEDPASPGDGGSLEELLRGVQGRTEGEVSSGGSDGVRRRFGFTALLSGGETTGATVAVGLPERAVTEPLEADLRESLLLVGLAALAALAAAWLFGGHFILRRVDALVSATRRIGAGNLEFRARTADRTGADSGELGHLERAFDDMARSLESRTRALREAEARYRHLVERMPAVFYLARPGEPLHLEYVSPQLRELTGHDPGAWEGRGDRWEEILHPDDRDRVRRDRTAAVAEGRSFVAEYRVIARNGSEVWVRDRATAADERDGGDGLLRGFLVDITERKDLERQFLQAQKMEAVGRLAAGVAHDFNNLLTVISGYGQLLDGRLRGDERGAEAVREIRLAADRAADLTRRLLSFSRLQARDPVVVDLNESLGSLRPKLERLAGDGVAVGLEPGAGLGRVRVDRGQLDQVVMNLVVNARDAMPEGGRLTLATGNADLDEEYVRRLVEVRPGAYVCLTVSDTGCGMDESVRERIFEPFFTTKAEGKGTGLGLSTVYGIVRQAGGHLEVYSAPWRGTTFKIYLPRAGGEPAPAADPPTGAPGAAAGGGRTVLLVEDDPVIRALAREVLEGAGHRVLEAASREAARKVAAARGGEVEVLVSDVGLPDGSGADLVRELVGAHPGWRAILVSGYHDGDPAGAPLPEGVRFLPKPFGPEELLEAVGRRRG